VDVSILIVNFNGGDTVLDCLNSVFVQTRGIEFEVLVVDNASMDESPDRIMQAFPAVNLIRNPDNRGFSRACNQALGASRGRLLLLLNGDTLLPGNAVKDMAAFLEEHRRAGIAGCMLLHRDGTYQKSAGRIRGIVNEWRERRTRNGMERGSRGAWRHEELFARNARSVDWVSGAFLMVRRSVMDRIGMLDERMFLFFEDIDWCTRARKAGWQVLYNPQVRVIHLGGKSIRQNTRQSRLEYRRSQLLFYRTHHGAGPDTQALRLYFLARALHALLEAGFKAQPKDRTRNLQMSHTLLRLALRGPV